MRHDLRTKKWVWAVGAVVIAAVALMVVSRVTNPGWGESVNLESWRKKVPVRSRAACRCSADERPEIRRADGLVLAARLDRPSTPGKQPAILLLHGNTPAGSGLGVYRVLGRKLAERGFLVLSVDFAGHGESEDPFRFGNPEAIDPDLDARAGLRFLEELEDVDGDSVHILCHSAGCGSGFSVGLAHDTVKRIVAVGPPRRNAQRYLDEENNEFFWQWARRTRKQLYGDDFPSWYTREVWMENRRRRSLENHLDALSRHPHKPVLLMDGGLESQANRDYLKGFFDSMVEPKTYVTVPRSNHYANTISKFGLALYDREVVERTVLEVEAFLNRAPSAADVEKTESRCYLGGLFPALPAGC